MEIKNLQQSDISKIIYLENETWPEGTRASKENFESRLNIFPDGVIGSLVDDDLAGLTTSMIVQLDDLNSIKSWEEITSEGSISNHNPEGNCLYVVSLGVSPRYQGKGVGYDLIKEQIHLGKRLGLKHLVLGSRIPEFHKFEGTIKEYLALKNKDGLSVDSLVRFYQKCGLKIGKVKPNYMEDDKESRNYGLIMYTEL